MGYSHLPNLVDYSVPTEWIITMHHTEWIVTKSHAPLGVGYGYPPKSVGYISVPNGVDTTQSQTEGIVIIKTHSMFHAEWIEITMFCAEWVGSKNQLTKARFDRKQLKQDKVTRRARSDSKK